MTPIIDYEVECLLCGASGPWYSRVEKFTSWDLGLCVRCEAIYRKSCPECGQPDCWADIPDPKPRKGCGIPCYDRQTVEDFLPTGSKYEPPTKHCKSCGHVKESVDRKIPGLGYPFDLPMEDYIERLRNLKKKLGW
jgi:hypothetical protein